MLSLEEIAERGVRSLLAEGTACAKCGGQVSASERSEPVSEREKRPAGPARRGLDARPRSPFL